MANCTNCGKHSTELQIGSVCPGCMKKQQEANNLRADMAKEKAETTPNRSGSFMPINDLSNVTQQAPSFTATPSEDDRQKTLDLGITPELIAKREQNRQHNTNQNQMDINATIGKNAAANASTAAAPSMNWFKDQILKILPKNKKAKKTSSTDKDNLGNTVLGAHRMREEEAAKKAALLRANSPKVAPKPTVRTKG